MSHRTNHGNREPHPHHGPYWKRAHTDWRFWTGVVLMFAAMIYYMASMDLSWRPRPLPQPRQVGTDAARK